MKFRVKVLSRDPEKYLRETKHDINKVVRNYDKSTHPFEAQREYSRAVNAAKLEKIFAKPYISTLDGHKDGVCCLERHSRNIKIMSSASCDGQIRIWDLSTSKTTSFVDNAHIGVIQGICFNTDGSKIFSVGLDNAIKIWNCDGVRISKTPISSNLSSSILFGIHHSKSPNTYAVCGDGVHIYDSGSNIPIHHFTYGTDSVKTIKFSPIEENILASSAIDRSVILYDIRQATPITKVTLAMKTNSISWNPMEAPVFIVANEDSNVYAFDLRKMEKPYKEYNDHTNAVLDVDFSPTGREFVAGSYDRSLRIFKFLTASSSSHEACRDVYHTKRMQRLFCVRYSGDCQYVLSGSDEMNIRLWKTEASKKLGYLRPREKRALEYADKLKERFKYHPEVRKIKNRKHLPRHLYTAVERQKTFFASIRRKIFRKETPRNREAVIHVHDEDESDTNE